MNALPPPGQAESKQLSSIREEDEGETSGTSSTQSLSVGVNDAAKTAIPEGGQVSTADLTKHKVTLTLKPSENVLQMQKESEVLEKTYTYKLPLPTAMIHVKQYVKIKSEDKMTLWRGCSREQLMGIANKGSAGGVNPEVDTRPPTEQEAKDQVGERISIPEFTCDPQVAQGFGTDTFIAAVKIPAKFLTKGSNTEAGWVCLPSAPVKLLAWKEGGSLNQTSDDQKSKPIQMTIEQRLQMLKEKNEALERNKGQASLSGRNIQSLSSKQPPSASNQQPRSGKLGQ